MSDLPIFICPVCEAVIEGDRPCPNRNLRPHPKDRVVVDPAVVTCAVRYAIPRHSYAVQMTTDVVRETWEYLGNQRAVIRADVADHVARVGREEQPAMYASDDRCWADLLAWMDAGGTGLA